MTPVVGWVVGSLIGWAIVAALTAVTIGRAIRIADQRQPVAS